RSHGSYRFHSGHPVSARCNLDRPMSACDTNQAEADNQHVRRQKEIRNLNKQRSLIVDMGFLILGTPERYVATPLVSYDPFIHRTANDIQDSVIEKELWNETRVLEGHRQEISMWSAVGFLMMFLQMIKENRPECITASINQ